MLLRQKMIYRKDLKANPDVLYIFGDNLDREGMGGQAGEMRGEPNGFGIATKRAISHGNSSDYFHDHEPDCKGIIDNEFSALRAHLEKNNYRAIVIPLDGLGTGLSKLPEFAPILLAYIDMKINQLKEDCI